MTESMPHAPMAEKSILSVMFRDPSRIARAAAEGIGQDAFHLQSHKALLDYLIRFRDAEIMTDLGELDLSILIQQASIDGNLERMGGPSAVADIFNYAISASGWSAWCDQLRECKARRIAVQGAQSLSEANDSEEAIETARATLDALRGALTAKTRAVNARQACDDFLVSYQATYQNGDLPGTGTGIQEIDTITGGMKPGELWTIGGPSSSGKSVLMYQVASQFVGDGKVVAIFSAELMIREIVGRLVTLKGRVPYTSITTPKTVLKPELDRIQTALREMAQTKMWIDATSGQSLETIAGESERIRDIEGQVDLIVVDYIQIVKGIRSKGDSREQEIASISGGLKQLAKKIQCPVITGTQLNDDGKTRESRAIEQDSDVLILIGDNGLTMRKNRNGKRDEVVNLALDGANQRFRYFAA